MRNKTLLSLVFFIILTLGYFVSPSLDITQNFFNTQVFAANGAAPRAATVGSCHVNITCGNCSLGYYGDPSLNPIPDVGVYDYAGSKQGLCVGVDDGGFDCWYYQSCPDASNGGQSCGKNGYTDESHRQRQFVDGYDNVTCNQGSVCDGGPNAD